MSFPPVHSRPHLRRKPKYVPTCVGGIGAEVNVSARDIWPGGNQDTSGIDRRVVTKRCPPSNPGGAIVDAASATVPPCGIVGEGGCIAPRYGGGLLYSKSTSAIASSVVHPQPAAQNLIYQSRTWQCSPPTTAGHVPGTGHRNDSPVAGCTILKETRAVESHAGSRGGHRPSNGASTGVALSLVKCSTALTTVKRRVDPFPVLTAVE